MRDPHYGPTCFKSVKTIGALPSALTFSTAENVELLGLYPILDTSRHYNRFLFVLFSCAVIYICFLRKHSNTNYSN